MYQVGNGDGRLEPTCIGKSSDDYLEYQTQITFPITNFLFNQLILLNYYFPKALIFNFISE